VALSAVDLSFRVEVWGERLSLPVLSPGKVGQEKGDGTCVDFLMPAISGRQHRSRTYGFGLNPENSGRDSPPSQYDLPGNFSIFREDYQPEFHLQRLSDIRTIWKD
jgi:hypothetical protein